MIHGKAVNALLEILELEDDTLEAERIRKEWLTQLIEMAIRTTFLHLTAVSTCKYLDYRWDLHFQLFANVYIDKLEEEFEKSLLQAKVLMRYLDDYALWLHCKENLNGFLNFINQLDERIKFTMEVEENERTPFLDTEVMRSNGTLMRGLYRKNSYFSVSL
ncbi:unnamed protein product [Protopolystoma xenopodis]|uniref:Reverse transcriptase domain-containing protein n=1 Tax=Protopolystoma xenopodis TaxID=117903 RepID=A0A448WDK8_9PLAT|nr:unnamed protein product [Protopolystoma xenopodis]